MPDQPTFAIVGAGLAGAKAAEALRTEGFAGRIVLLGAEPHRPYERPPLSKGYLQGSADRDTVYVHPAEWYADHQIDLRLGTAVTALDRRAHEIVTADGNRLRYNKLLLATGATPRRLPVPGADLAGVHYLRTLDDSDQLKAALRPGTRVVIIGGGWIGLETAAAARTAGAEVTVLEQGELPLLRVLGPQVAQVFADLHTENGVDLRCGVTVAEIRPAATNPTTAGRLRARRRHHAGRRRDHRRHRRHPERRAGPVLPAQRRQRHPRQPAPAHLRRGHLRRRRRRQRLPPAATPAAHQRPPAGSCSATVPRWMPT